MFFGIGIGIGIGLDEVGTGWDWDQENGVGAQGNRTIGKFFMCKKKISHFQSMVGWNHERNRENGRFSFLKNGGVG